MKTLSLLPFPDAAREALKDHQLRRNLERAVQGGTPRRERALEEVENWEEQRERGRLIRDNAIQHLDELLVRLESNVKAAGGHVHWARDAPECNNLVAEIMTSYGAREAVKMKSLLTDEINLNGDLQKKGIQVWETDLAEVILQLADDFPSHMGVPALHLNRSQIRDVFASALGKPGLSDDPAELCHVARDYLRVRLERAPVGITGANFAVAETGSICVLESEGNGRMTTTLPETLITVMGIEKVLAHWSDLAVMLRLLPRSSSGERLTPYVSIWTGTTASDGPRAFHLILFDGGRTKVLRNPATRQTLHCIRCSACLNVCPVYRQTGGRAYSSIYSGPIGAILTPQLQPSREASTLPFASTLCGACYDVCPVKIDIPTILVHLRSASVEAQGRLERATLTMFARVLASRRHFEAAQQLARFLGRRVLGERHSYLPGLGRWLQTRDMPSIPTQSFRTWWRQRR